MADPEMSCAGSVYGPGQTAVNPVRFSTRPCGSKPTGLGMRITRLEPQVYRLWEEGCRFEAWENQEIARFLRFFVTIVF